MKETFESRLRYNALAIDFVDKLILWLAPFTLLAFTLYPLGVLHSERYTTLGYIVFNVGIGLYAMFKYLQLKGILKRIRIVEALALGLLVMGGGSFLAFVSGFQHPIVSFWLIAVLIAHLYFGIRGFIFVLVVVACIAVLDVFVQSSSSLPDNYIINSLMYLATLNVVAIVLIRVLNITSNSQRVIEETKRREEQQNEKLQAVLNNMAEGLIAVNSRGLINLQNGTTLSILDTNESLVGKHLGDVLKLTDTAGKHIKASDLLASKHQIMFRDDIRHHFSKDDFVSLSLLVTPIRSGFGQKKTGINSGFVIILRDITREKSLEEEKDEFVSVVSHELRTPVAVAEGSLGNLLFLAEKGSDKSQIVQTAKAAHDQVVFLATMINDLGTLSRAERGVGDNAEEININQMCADLNLKYSGQAAAKGLELKMDIQPDLPTVVQSRLYLEETLQNFITNAIKYTREGSVTLHAKLLPEGVELAVSDTGIGISTSDQKRVYEKFFRSEDYRTRENGGTGLGLYVVKKLIDKMGVQIHLQSKLNEGSRFSIVVPVTEKTEVSE